MPTAASMMAEVKEFLAEHPGWKNRPWGEVLFGEEFDSVLAWLATAADDDVLARDTKLPPGDE